MATPDATLEGRTGDARRRRVFDRDETKPSFLTTELYVLLGTIVAILIAVAQADNFDSPRAWTLIAALAIGYMVSRGLAKSGSSHLSGDDRR